jgi:hypothetical protein
MPPSTTVPNPESAKKDYDDLKGRMKKHGRSPASLCVLAAPHYCPPLSAGRHGDGVAG